MKSHRIIYIFSFLLLALIALVALLLNHNNKKNITAQFQQDENGFLTITNLNFVLNGLIGFNCVGFMVIGLL